MIGMGDVVNDESIQKSAKMNFHIAKKKASPDEGEE